MTGNPNTIPSLVYTPANSGLGTKLNVGAPWIDEAIAGVNANGVQVIAASAYTNATTSTTFVDPTGVTDSWAALVAMVASAAQMIAAGTPVKLLIDCPLRVTIGLQYAKPIFLPSGLTIECVPGIGYFITDAVMLHLFDIVNMTDITFRNLDILYVGTPGVTAINPVYPGDPSYATLGNYNDITGKNFLLSPTIGGVQQFTPPNLVSGSGASYCFPSSTNACALVAISGACDRIAFLGRTRFRVPTNAPMCNYVSFAISLYANWYPGATVTGNSNVTAAGGAAVPNYVYIEDCLLDGVCMGVCGTATNLIAKIRSRRYGDLCDANGDNFGGQCFTEFTLASAPATGASLITLASPWPYASTSTPVTMSDGSTLEGAFIRVTFSAAIGATATSATLASGTYPSGWPNQTGAYLLTFSDGEVKSVTLTQGQTTATWTGGLTGGVTNVAQSATVALTSYQGGPSTLQSSTYATNIGAQFSQNWFAPPHPVYVHQLDFVGSFPMTSVIDLSDEGVYFPASYSSTSYSIRNTGSGYMDSAKVEPANGSTFKMVSTRVHGGVDVLSFGQSNGEIELYSVMDSTVFQNHGITFTAALSGAVSATLSAPWRFGSGTQTYTVTFSSGVTRTCTFVLGQATCTWSGAVTATQYATVANTSQAAGYGVRMPSAPPLVGMRLTARVIDTNAVPIGFPILGDGQIGNTDLTYKTEVTLNDWPLAATWVPGYAMGGSNINIDSTIIFKNCSSTATYLGSAENTGSIQVNQSNYKLTLIGWRQTQLLFTGTAIANNVTTATLSSTAYPAGFPYPSGVYTVSFSDGEQRQLTLTNGSATATWTGTLTNAVTNVASLSLLNAGNFDSMKNRVFYAQSGFSYSNVLEVNDATNGYRAWVEDNLLTEQWTQGSQFNPTGTAYSTAIQFPASFAIVGFGYRVTVALVGPTAINVGDSANATRFISAGGVAYNTNPYIAAQTPIALVNSTTTVQVSAASAISGGSMYMAFKGIRYSMAG